MKRFRVDLLNHHQLEHTEWFNAEEDARRYYRQHDPPPMLTMELWQFHPPVTVVMGHRVSRGWERLESKTGAEEFC